VDAHYFDGLNATEIGEELQMTSGAVRKVLFKTRHLLADCLTGKDLGKAT
jgi:DNA-directed RNA polymerase specialized sigma24 family protein